MDALIAVVSLLAVIANIIVVLFFKHHLSGYFAQKGKNLATKEDIAEITQKVESVKHGFNADISRLNAALDTSSHVSKMRFEMEFEIYKELWSQLVVLRDAALTLRPEFDAFIPGQEDAERTRRLKAVADAYNAFYRTVENNKPFYSSAIWTELSSLLSISRVEFIQYKNRNQKQLHDDYDQAKANQRQITQATDKICEAIRNRVDFLSGISTDKN